MSELPPSATPAATDDAPATQSTSTITRTLSHISHNLLGSSSLNQGAMLMVAGTAFELFRRYSSVSLDNLISSFVIHGSFHERSSTYNWIGHFLERQPFYQNSGRRFEINTQPRRYQKPFEHEPDSEDEDSDTEDTEIKSYRWPAEGEQVYFVFRNHICYINHTKEVSNYGRGWSMFNLTMYSRDPAVFDELVSEAKALYLNSKRRRGTISTYIIESGEWELLRSTRKRPIESLILPDGIKDALIEDAKGFIKSKPWYQERGIPFRRGYCLWGNPGAGKSSTVVAVAGELNLDIYILSLSDKSLTDSSLMKILNMCPEKCIVCIEDIDCAFADREQKENAIKEEASAGITLSGLLNALDSSGASESRLLFCTTNYIDKLDPALKRPGRLDCMVEYRDATKDQARTLFKRFFPATPKPEQVPTASLNVKPHVPTAPPSGPTTQPIGIGSLFHVAVGLLGIKGIYSNPNSSPNLLVTAESSEKLKKSPTRFSAIDIPEAEYISEDELQQLSNQFADAIPHETFSIASLQGYCLLHKNKPRVAAAGIHDWIVKELEKLSKPKNSSENESVESNKFKTESDDSNQPENIDRDSNLTTRSQVTTPDSNQHEITDI